MLRGGELSITQETPLENFTHFAIFTRSSVVSWLGGCSGAYGRPWNARQLVLPFQNEKNKQ